MSGSGKTPVQRPSFALCVPASIAQAISRRWWCPPYSARRIALGPSQIQWIAPIGPQLLASFSRQKRVWQNCGRTLLVTPTGFVGVYKYLTNQEKVGRGEKIRTSGPCLPKAVLYQAELHPVLSRQERLWTEKSAMAIRACL